MKTKALSYVFLVVAIGLAFYLYRAVKGPMEEKARIEKAELLVQHKLELIRESQKAYIKTNNRYANKWEELITFVESGVIYNVELKEKAIPRPDRPWLGDSIAISKDTLEAIASKGYIAEELNKNCPTNKLKEFSATNLPFKTGTQEKFEMYTGKIPMGGAMVDIIEVKDPNPIDKTRKEDHDLPDRRNLRFGSKDEVSTSGNWKGKQ